MKDVNGRKEGLILEEFLSEKKMNQKDLAIRCQEKGYSVSQSSISKIVSGKKKMSLEECRAFCEVFGVSSDTFIFPEKFESKERQDVFFLLEKSALAAAKLLVGEYQMFFMSTANEEYRMLDGILKLTYSGSFVCADIEINARDGRKKVYHGFLYFSSQWTVAYIVVKNSGTGEISVLAFRYRKFAIESMKCRIAMCLTTSAGEQKNPSIHRVLLFRERTSITHEFLRKYLALRGMEYPNEQDWDMLRISEKLSNDTIESLKHELSKKKEWTLDEEQLKDILLKTGVGYESNIETVAQRLKMYLVKNYSYRLAAEDDTELYAICQELQKSGEVL